MKAIVHAHASLAHQRQHARAMRAGLERHGVAVEYGDYNTPTLREIDFAVIWGSPSKQPWVAQSSPRVLVMERGHLQDRMQYTSCGWDGLGRRGRYPKADDGGARWLERWGVMQPWRHRARGLYALLIGQVPEDAALDGLSGGFQAWAQTLTNALLARCYSVRFRPHPFVLQAGSRWCPDGADLAPGSLADDLAGAAVCVTYNSTTGVEAVLAGVPTVTMDQGAMAWDVAGHALDEVVRPDRDAWAHDLAWTNYSLDEIASGVAWERLAPIMEEAPCPSA